MRTLILNHDKKECGTYQFAKRIAFIVGDFDCNYYDVSDRETYLWLVSELNPDCIIYNWHRDRIDWLRESDITPNRRHYFLFHDGSNFGVYDKYIFCGEYPNYQVSIPKEKSVLLPRPLIDYDGDYPINDVPTIGSFGFATDHKRFPELVTLVNQTFDKAHIRLHITSPYFGVTEGYNLPKIVSKCISNNVNPNIELTINTKFVNDQELLKFLAGNDINVFYYEYMKNPGISSAIDYALSVNRPFAVTKNNLFRHVAIDEILMENNSIKDIIDRGLEPTQRFRDMWSTSNFKQKFNEMLK